MLQLKHDGKALRILAVLGDGHPVQAPLGNLPRLTLARLEDHQTSRPPDPVNTAA